MKKRLRKHAGKAAGFLTLDGSIFDDKTKTDLAVRAIKKNTAELGELPGLLMRAADALKLVAQATDVPAVNEIQCGNYRLHSLELAKKYAADVLKKGLSDRYLK